MKSLIWMMLPLFLAAGCSKEATVDTPTEEAPVELETPADEMVSTDVTTADEEVLEVVEESAAVVEPTDEAIMLARADEPAAARNWQFKERQHYTRLIPTQPTVGGADKIEVAEVFMYSCPHCYDLESFLNSWAKTKDPNVRFVRIPAVFNQIARLHAQLYYTEEVLAENGTLADQDAFRNMVFEEFHRRGNRLASEASIQRLFVRAGVSEDDFKRTWASYEVDHKMRVAADLARRYSIVSVPTMIVNGKYRTDAAAAGSYPKLIELIDELTVREGLR